MIKMLADSTKMKKGAALQIERHYFSMDELAIRWRCSRGTVYNRLRAAAARVLDFAPPGKRARKRFPRMSPPSYRSDAKTI
jgi:hypothetical protein